MGAGQEVGGTPGCQRRVRGEGGKGGGTPGCREGRGASSTIPPPLLPLSPPLYPCRAASSTWPRTCLASPTLISPSLVPFSPYSGRQVRSGPGSVPEVPQVQQVVCQGVGGVTTGGAGDHWGGKCGHCQGGRQCLPLMSTPYSHIYRHVQLTEREQSSKQASCHISSHIKFTLSCAGDRRYHGAGAVLQGCGGALREGMEAREPGLSPGMNSMEVWNGWKHENYTYSQV